jgi:hypothetical protein
MADDTVQVKLTADTADLQAELQQAAQAAATAFGAINKAAADMRGQVTGSATDTTRELVKTWEQAFKPIESGFDTMLKGMILRHQSFSQALAKGAATFLTAEVNADVKRLGHWLATKAAELAAHQSTKGAEVATTEAANAAGAASDAGTAKTNIMQHAASAASAVYDDVAQIPYVGWILAPAAAAAAFAGVMAFGSAVPGLAVGAWNLPNDKVAQLHAGESVLRPISPRASARRSRAGAAAPAVATTTTSPSRRSIRKAERNSSRTTPRRSSARCKGRRATSIRRCARYPDLVER